MATAAELFDELISLTQRPTSASASDLAYLSEKLKALQSQFSIQKSQTTAPLVYNPFTGLFTRNGRPVGSMRPDGYLRIYFQGKSRRAHRLAWLLHYGYLPDLPIDHKNGILTDNRIENLRIATVRENSRNRSISSRNKSGFKGVVYHRAGRGWVAYITVKRKKKYLGFYKDPESAHAAYAKAAADIFGEFARLK